MLFGATCSKATRIIPGLNLFIPLSERSTAKSTHGDVDETMVSQRITLVLLHWTQRDWWVSGKRECPWKATETSILSIGLGHPKRVTVVTVSGNPGIHQICAI